MGLKKKKKTGDSVVPGSNMRFLIWSVIDSISAEGVGDCTSPLMSSFSDLVFASRIMSLTFAAVRTCTTVTGVFVAVGTPRTRARAHGFGARALGRKRARRAAVDMVL